MLSVDGSGFPKKGRNSAGAKCRAAAVSGRWTAARQGLSSHAQGPNVHALADSALYVPKERFSKEFADFREKCLFSRDQGLETKRQIALHMLVKALTRRIWLRLRSRLRASPARWT
ncbi:MAG: transposase [Eubacteriaceae bacterium]|nr:transposase [Eubacteriaceae bacterium]